MTQPVFSLVPGTYAYHIIDPGSIGRNSFITNVNGNAKTKSQAHLHDHQCFNIAHRKYTTVENTYKYHMFVKNMAIKMSAIE